MSEIAQVEATRILRVASIPVVWYRILRRFPVIPGIILLAMAVMAIFASQIAPFSSYTQVLRDSNAPPYLFNKEWYQEHPRVTNRYPLGADYVGRDILSRLIYGSRISLSVAGIAIVTGALVGSTLGIVAGYAGGLTDEFIMRLVDAWLSMPFILVAMVVATVFGTSTVLLMGLLALLAWSTFVRNVRAEVLSLKGRDYVALARVAGASNRRIVLRHIVPSLLNTIVVLASLRVAS